MNRRRRAANLVRLSLFAWPVHARARDGPALARAFEDEWEEHQGLVRQLKTTLSECGAIVIAGPHSRWAVTISFERQYDHLIDL